MLRVSDLREHLRLPRSQDPDDGQQENYLLGLRNAAVAHIERATNRYLGPLEEVTRLVGGTGTGTLWLPDELASASDAAPHPEEVTEYLSAGADATAIVGADTDGFLVVAPNRLLRKSRGYWTARVLYEVTYWRGYPVAGLPESYDDDPAVAAAAYAETPEAYLVGTPGDMQQALRLLVAHWFVRRVPVTVAAGEQTEEIPHTLREVLENGRYLFV